MKKTIKKAQLLLSVEKLRALDGASLQGVAGGQKDECGPWTRCRVTVTGQSAACR